MWDPSVSALTGYQAGHFPAWEQPPGNLHMSKLLLHATTKALGHHVQSWLALCLSVGSWLPSGLFSRRCSSSQRICYLDSVEADWSHSSSRKWSFSSHFVAASSRFRLGSSLGVAGSKFSALSRLAWSTSYCHCSASPHLCTTMSSHSTQLLAKLRATL